MLRIGKCLDPLQVKVRWKFGLKFFGLFSACWGRGDLRNNMVGVKEKEQGRSL